MTKGSAKNNKGRGAAYERDIARRLGGTRHWADTGGKEDVEHPSLSIQIKSGLRVVNNTIREGLDAARSVANGQGKLGCLAIVDRSGSRLRRFVVFDLDEFADFHGMGWNPDSPLGYTWPYIEARLTPEQIEELTNWLRGQTMGVDKNGNGVVYADDLERWLRGERVIYD